MRVKKAATLNMGRVKGQCGEGYGLGKGLREMERGLFFGV
jgi:hypothetical protein